MDDASRLQELGARIEENRRVGEALMELAEAVLEPGDHDRSIFAPGAMISRAFIDQVVPLAPPASSEGAEQQGGGLGPTYREHFAIHPFPEGFVFQETLRRDYPDGAVKRVLVAGVCTVENSRITHIEEYADAAKMRDIMQ